MLSALRSFSKHIIIKILLGALALSFVIWGIGDVFRGRSSTSIAKIGRDEISIYDFQGALQREVNRYQEVFGKTLSEEQINQLGIRKYVLNQLIDERIIRKRVKELNIMVGLDTIKELLVAEPAFLDESGKFSREQFKKVLAANGLTEENYVNSLRNDMAMRMLFVSMSSAQASIEKQVEALFNYRNEKRIADILVVPDNIITSIPEPLDTDLVAFYKKNSSKFAIPETREASYVTFDFAKILKDFTISDDDVNKEYESNPSLYYSEATRNVDQYLFDSEDEAKNAANQLKSGFSASVENKKISLGNVTKDGLLDDVKETVFSLKEKEVSQPVKTSLGWHVFVVNAINEAKQKNLSEVKDEIKNRLKEERAADEFYQFANKIEDDLASGLKLEEVAEKYALVLHKIPAVDSNGNNLNGKEVNEIPEKQVFLQNIFAAGENETSSPLMMSSNDAYLITRVDKIMPARERALDEVKGMVTTMWQDEQKELAIHKKANEFVEALKKGATIYDLQNKNGLKIKADQKISRPTNEEFLSGLGGNEPVLLANELFKTEIGKPTGAYRAEDGSFYIAVLKGVEKADKEASKSSYLKMQEAAKEEFSNDILAQYNTYLRSMYNIQVNTSMLDQKSDG